MKKITLSLLTFLVMFACTAFSEGWQSVPSGTTFILYGMSVPPGQNNIAYSAGMQYTYDAPGVIVKTTNNGNSWTKILPVSGEIEGLQAVCFTDVTTGFAGGWNNYFIKTTDGGANWADVSVGNNIWYFTDIKFWDDDNGVATAKMNTGGGKIFVTADGGNVWTQATGITAEPFGVDYADANTLFTVCSDNKIYKSTNGGSAWSSVYTAGGLVLGVNFYDANFGVVSGEDGAVYTTTNGGSSWIDDVIAGAYPNLWAAWAFDGDSAYVGGTDEIIYKTVDGGSSWTLAYDGPGSSTLYRIEFTENGTGFACGSQGKMLRRDPPLGADFEADETVICNGGSVQFTDLSTSATSWSWIFEGGTPNFSVDQNPTVVYTNAGIYDVTLTVSDGVAYSTMLKQNYISVLETPAQANVPVGEIELCTGMSYEYSTDSVVYAQSYEWAVAPPAAGFFIGDENEVVFEASESWTGSFIIKVKAVNICGEGEWSEGLACQLFVSPSEFEVTGGGEICEGDDGVEIGLDGSEVDVDYELYNYYVATGIIVAGTGEAISFGLIADEGNYTVVGSNDNCMIEMIGEASVVVNTIPNQLTQPEGETEVCNDGENEYSTSGGEESDVISWFLSPSEAGSVNSSGMTATVTWNYDFEGEVLLTAQAGNDCGLGLESDPLEIFVYDIPAPDISGEDFVCINEEDTYFTYENEGSTYEWEVIGGTITSGEGTAQISVLWGNNPGQGFVIVNEAVGSDCSGIDAFSVTIDECTGIGNSIEVKNIRMYPNPAQSTLYLDFSANNNIQIEISIYNSMGMLINQKLESATEENQTSNIDIETLQNGIYIVSLKYSEQVIWNGKFTKN
jgi:PKD repeat protein